MAIGQMDGTLRTARVAGIDINIDLHVTCLVAFFLTAWTLSNSARAGVVLLLGTSLAGLLTRAHMVEHLQLWQAPSDPFDQVRISGGRG